MSRTTETLLAKCGCLAGLGIATGAALMQDAPPGVDS